METLSSDTLLHRCLVGIFKALHWLAEGLGVQDYWLVVIGEGQRSTHCIPFACKWLLVPPPFPFLLPPLLHLWVAMMKSAESKLRKLIRRLMWSAWLECCTLKPMITCRWLKSIFAHQQWASVTYTWRGIFQQRQQRGSSQVCGAISALSACSDWATS